MDLGSIFLILALALLVAWYVSRPFFTVQNGRVHVDTSSREHQRSALLAERDRLLHAIQELDFDNALGKIPEEDYPQQRAYMLSRAAEVLRALDALDHREPGEQDFEAQVEAALTARRASPSTEDALPRADEVDVSQNDELEELLARRRRERQGKAAGFCPRCGKPIQKTDRFCPKCGARVK